MSGSIKSMVITFSTTAANNNFSYILDDRYSFKNCSRIGFGHGDWSAGIVAGISKVPDNLSLKNCETFGITSGYLTNFIQQILWKNVKVLLFNMPSN